MTFRGLPRKPSADREVQSQGQGEGRTEECFKRQRPWAATRAVPGLRRPRPQAGLGLASSAQPSPVFSRSVLPSTGLPPGHSLSTRAEGQGASSEPAMGPLVLQLHLQVSAFFLWDSTHFDG